MPSNMWTAVILVSKEIPVPPSCPSVWCRRGHRQDYWHAALLKRLNRLVSQITGRLADSLTRSVFFTTYSANDPAPLRALGWQVSSGTPIPAHHKHRDLFLSDVDSSAIFPPPLFAADRKMPAPIRELRPSNTTARVAPLTSKAAVGSCVIRGQLATQGAWRMLSCF